MDCSRHEALVVVEHILDPEYPKFDRSTIWLKMAEENEKVVKCEDEENGDGE